MDGNWKDIQTAPKNGRTDRIDLWIVRLSSSGKPHDKYRVPDCYWDERKRRWRSPWTRHGDRPIPPTYEATHWMESVKGPNS